MGVERARLVMVTPPPPLSFLPERPDWDVQIMRLVAEAAFGGADPWECQRIADDVRERGLTQEAWHDAWAGAAERLVAEAHGEGASTAPSDATRRDALLRAFSYFRTAEFFLPMGGEERLVAYSRARGAFQEALPLLPVRAETVSVPDGDATYEGYVFSPPGGDGEPGPGVLCMGGADSYAEELYLFGAKALVDRGATVMVVDTPGRGIALRRDKLRAIAEYERPASKALDVLAAHPGVDPERIGVVGSSLGGYYGPRLASADERVKALVSWCACFDVLRDLYDYYPPIQAQMRWVVGADDDAEARRILSDFNLKDAAPRITCPILISHGANDEFMPTSSAEELFESVGSADKQLKVWDADEGGALHCGYDNWAAYVPLMFDWLLDQLRR
jgi:dipeptidyl aminopeptidase/acylaminoacyl peptidase